jgi:RimJ/RimL family protein N-acetyltransferase
MDASADIYVEVVDFNEQAINFYRKLGFVPTGRTIRDERFRMKSGAIFTEIEMVLKAR